MNNIMLYTPTVFMDIYSHYPLLGSFFYPAFIHMKTQQLEKIRLTPPGSKMSLEKRLQKAILAYERACKAANFQQRLQLDALE